MKYNKLLYLILLSLFLTGCNDKQDTNTIYYNLNIGTSYEEKIDIYLPKDAYKIAKENQQQEESYINLENRLLYQDIEPIFSEPEELYNKKIKKNLNNIKVELNYTYIEDDFVYSKYIMNCFEHYDITTTNDSVTINLSGEFYCLNDKENVNIKVNSIFDTKRTNGTLENNSYVWNINKDNVNNTNISHIISRNYDGMIKDREDVKQTKKSNINGWEITKLIIIIIILGVVFILYKKYKNNQTNNF